MLPGNLSYSGHAINSLILEFCERIIHVLIPTKNFLGIMIICCPLYVASFLIVSALINMRKTFGWFESVWCIYKEKTQGFRTASCPFELAANRILGSEASWLNRVASKDALATFLLPVQ